MPQPNPQQKKKPESKNSETDSSEVQEAADAAPEDTIQEETIDIDALVAEKVEEICQSVKEALMEMVGKPADPETVTKAVMETVKGLLEDEDDAALVYDVKLVTQDRIVISVKGAAKLSGLFDQSSVTEAPEVFQSVFYNSVWQPLRVRLFRKLQEKAKTNKAIPSLMGGMEDDDGLPQIPIPGAASDRLPMGE